MVGINKTNNSFSFIFILIFSMFSFFSLLQSLYAQTDADIQTIITQSASKGFDEKTLALDNAFESASGSGETYSDITKNQFFDAMEQLFQDRLNKKYLDPSQTLPLQTLHILFSSAADESSPFYLESRAASIETHFDMLMLENLILSLKSQSDYAQQLEIVRNILFTARNVKEEFVPAVKSIFYANLKGVYDNRATADGTALRPAPLPDTLKLRLNAAKTTALLTPTDQAKLPQFVNTVTLEQSISALLALPDFPSQINGIQTIAQANATAIFEPVTQNIFFNVVQQIFAKHATIDPTIILTNRYATMLYQMLSTINNSPFINPITHQPIITLLLSIVATEVDIEAIFAATDYNTKLDLTTAAITRAANKKLTSFVTTLFNFVLQDTFNNRPRKTLDMLLKLRNILATQLPSSIVLTTTQKNYVQNPMIPTLDADIRNLRRLDLLIPPATNNTPIADLNNTTRLIDLGTLLGENTGKPLDPDIEIKIFNALQRSYDTRQMTTTELTALKALYTNWLANNLLTTDHNTIVQSWLKQVNAQLILINLGAITDPNIIINSLDPNSFTFPLSPQMQTSIFAALQKAYNARLQNFTLTYLTNLKNLLQKWLDTNALTTTQNTTITGWIAQINKELQSLGIADVLGGIKGLGIDDQSTKIADLLNSINSANISLTPTQQAQVFDFLRNIYNTAIVSNNPDLINKTINLLSAWLASKRLAQDPYGNTIQGWINNLQKALAALQAHQAIQNLNENSPLSDLDPRKYAGIKLTPEEATKIFGILQKKYNDLIGRIDSASQPAPTVTEITELRDLLKAWADSNQLLSDQTNTINTVWLPRLNAEIDKLNKIIQIIAWGKTTGTGGLPTGIPMTPPAIGGSVDPQTQQDIFAALTKMYEGRDRNNLQALTQLRAILVAWSTSPILNGDQQGTITGTWIPTIDGELTGMKEKAILDGIGKRTNPLDIISDLEKFLDDNGGKPLDDTTEANVFALLQKAYNGVMQNQKRTLDMLNKLQHLLTRWFDSKLLKIEHNNIIGNEWLPMIDLAKTIFVTGFIPLIQAMQTVLTTHAGKDIAAAAQTAFLTILTNLFNQRTSNFSFDNLSALLDLLTKALATTFISDAQKPVVQTTMIDVIKQELAQFEIENAIRQAVAQPSFGAQINALQAIIPTIQSLTLANRIQMLYFTAIQTIAPQRQTQGVDLLATFLSLLQAALPSNIIAEAQRPTLQALIQLVQQELITRQFETDIKNAMALTDYLAKMKAYNDIITRAINLIFISATQNLFAQAIVAAFNDRVKQTLDGLNALAVMLKNALTTSLLAATQQIYLKNMLDTLSIELAVNTALALDDYGAQLDAMLDMIFKYKAAKIVDPYVKDLFFRAVNIIFARRITQYTIDQIGDTNIDKLALFLVTTQSSTLLDSKNQARVDFYNDMVTFEQPIIDTFKLLYPQQLANASRIIQSADQRTFDNVTNTIAFKLIKQLFDQRNPSDTANIELLKQMLTLAASSPLLNLSQQQDVRTMLASLGVTLPASPLATALQNTLSATDSQTQMKQLITIIPQLATTGTDANAAASVLGLLQKITPQNATEKQLYTQALSLMQQSPFFSSQQQYIQTIALPTVQAPQITYSATGLPMTALPAQKLPTLQNPLVAVGYEISANSQTLQGINTITNPSEKLDMLAAFLTSGQAQGIDIQTEAEFEKILTQMASKPQNLDPLSLAKLSSLLQQTSTAYTTSQKFKGTLATLTPNINTLVTTGLAPTLKNAQKIIALTDPSSRIDNILLLLDQNAGKPVDSKVKNLVANALNSLVQQSGSYDVATLAKLQGLLEKTQSGDFLIQTQKDFIGTKLLPTVIAKAAQAQLPTTQSIKAITQQKQPSKQLDGLEIMLQNAAQTPPDDNAKKAIVAALKQLAGKKVDPATQARLANVINKAQNTLALDPQEQADLNNIVQQLTTQTGLPTPVVKPTTAKPTVVKPTTTAKAPTQQDVAKIAAIKDKKAQIKAAEQMVTQAQKLPANAATQKAFTSLLKQIIQDNLNADPATLQKIASIIQQTQGTQLMSAADKKNVFPTMTNQVNTALTQATTKAKPTTTKPVAPTTTVKPTTPTISKPTTAKAPTQQDVAKIAAIKDKTAQLKALDQMVDQAQKLPANTATQKEISKLLQAITQKNINADPATLAKIAAVTQKMLASQLLPPSDKTTIFPKLTTQINTALKKTAAPTAANINRINTLSDPEAKIESLMAMIDQADGESIDAPTKTAFGSSVKALLEQKKKLSPSNQQKLDLLLAKVQTSSLVSPADQQELAQLASQTAMPSGMAVRPPTKQDISTIAAIKDNATQLRALEKFVEQSQNQPVDQATQQDFEKLFRDVTSKNLNADPATLAKIATITQKMQATQLLSTDAQTNLLPTITNQIDSAMTQMAIPTTTIASRIRAQTDPESKIDSLLMMIDQAVGQPIDANTQKAFGDEVDRLLAQKAKLPTAIQTKLNTLIAKAQGSPLFSPEEQKALISGTTPVSAVTVRPPTKQDISTIAAIKDNATQLRALEKFVEQSQNQPVDQATQQDFEKLFRDVTSKNINADPATLAKIAAITQKMQATQLLSTDAQTNLLPTITNQIGSAITQMAIPTTTIASRIKAQTDPESKIDSLLMVIDQAAGQPITSNTQQAFGDIVDQLLAQKAKLPTALQTKINTLIAKAQGSPLFSIVTQQALAQASTPTTTTTHIPMQAPTMQDIKNLASITDKATQLKTLAMLFKQSTGQKVPTDVQQEFARTFTAIVNNNMNADAGIISELLSFSQQATTSSLLSPADQKIIATSVRQDLSQALVQAVAPMQTTLQTINQTADINAQITLIEQMIKDYATTFIDPGTQQTFAQTLANVVAKSAQTDTATKQRILLLIQKAQPSSLVGTATQATIQSLANQEKQILSGLTAPAGGLVSITQALGIVSKAPTTQAKLQESARLLTAAQGKTISAQDGASLVAIIQAAIQTASSTKDTQAIGQAQQLMQVINTATVLTAQQRNTLIAAIQKLGQGVGITTTKPTTAPIAVVPSRPGVAPKKRVIATQQDVTAVARRTGVGASQAVKNAFDDYMRRVNRETTVQGKLQALQQLANWAQGKTMGKEQQQATAQLLQTLVKTIPTGDTTSQATLRNINQNILKTTLLNDAQKQQISK